jgi:type II secretory ATPase GspE/PulE/Tfp pilus assembly ATPase PilB-like protein
LSLVKLVPVLLLYFAWVFAANWVNVDTQDLRANTGRWNLFVLLAGLAGLAVLWMIPIYAAALAITAIALLGPSLIYVVIRNSKVPEQERVLTGEHLGKVWGQLLARGGLGGARPGQSPRARHEAASLQFAPFSDNGDEKLKRQAAQIADDQERVLVAKELMFDAIERRATDVHIEPEKDQVAIRYRIDGMLHNADPFDRPTGESVMQIFKGIGGLVLAEKRKPQQGRLQVLLNGREIEVRVASRGTRDGETMRLRILDKRTTISKLADLGMRTKLRESVAELVTQKKGLFLVAGPSGSGKTTTLFAALREIDRFQRHIVSIEESIEFHVENVSQVDVGGKSGEEVLTELRRVLRDEPDGLALFELREAPVAQLACQAAADRLVLSCLAANDTISALFRLFDLRVDRDKLAKVLTGILAQRLVRKLCEACKEPYRPRPEFLKKANVPAGKVDVFYRPPREVQEVCRVCGGTGYYGRTGLFELFVVNDRLRKLIREDASVTAIKAEARKSGMLYLQEEGLRLVIRGTTSIQELMRIVK